MATAGNLAVHGHKRDLPKKERKAAVTASHGAGLELPLLFELN
jgi:hypothetical protein